VSVREFLGTLVYESRGGSKVVHYWRMDAGRDPVRKLMRDVKAVEWLPLADAVERLSRGYERAFLESVGPIALRAAGSVAESGGSVAFEPREIVAVGDDVRSPRRSFVQRVRDWLRRAA
jgi:8-oxo-dGTP diphosphatase